MSELKGVAHIMAAPFLSSPVHRRAFLKRAAALAGGGLLQLPRSLRAAPQGAAPNTKADIRFGFSLYGMRSLDVLEALQTCAEIGYDCVEVVATEGWPCDPAALAKHRRTEIHNRLDELNLQLAAVMENLHLVVDEKQHRINIDRLKAAGQLGHELSPKKPPVVETILGGRPEQWDELKHTMVERLGDWARAGEAANTVIAVKPHVGGALHRPQDAKWLAHEVGSPWIKLAYDYSHFQLRGFDLEESLRTMLVDTAFIHVKDAQGTAEKVRFLLPGEGDVDYANYFGLLNAAGYRGAAMVEVSGQIHGRPEYDPVLAARTSYNNLAPVFAKAGLRSKQPSR